MPVTIPSPLSAPSQGRPGTFEQILLSLAQSSPALLTFFLDRQAQQREQETIETGQDAAAAAQISSGNIPGAADLVSQLGGTTQGQPGFQMPPLAGVQGAQPGPQVAPTITGVDTHYRPKGLQLHNADRIREVHFGWPEGKLIAYNVVE